ncbi:MAG: DinB family protein, partial [Gemmatimonadaceae bacterium]|nr:DinB family protein [Gemmatimonadaceae bacterium]
FSPYYAGYVARVPDGDVVETLRSQVDATMALARSLAEEKGGHRYAPGKWSIREVLGHMADTERIMAYRALRVARGDATPLPGFDENLYVENARFDDRTLSSLADDLAIARQSTIALLAPLGDDELGRVGSANGAPITARALAWIIAGHERHHLAILRERYL